MGEDEHGASQAMDASSHDQNTTFHGQADYGSGPGADDSCSDWKGDDSGDGHSSHRETDLGDRGSD